MTKWRPNKNWALLLLALALGGLAAYLSDRLLSEHMREIEAEARRGQELVPVVVAKRELQRGDTISSADFAVRQVPRDYLQSDAVTPNSFGELENQRLAVAMRRGDVLLPAYSEGLGGQVFSALLTKGRRALTIEVDTVSALSGMLRPGDHVDLIYSVRSDSADSVERTLPLMSNVQVLATDQSISKHDDGNGGGRSFSTVTLDVTPRDAQRIVMARQAGRLTAILRNPDDEGRNTTGVMSAGDLVQGTARAAAPSGPRGVEIITGGGGAMADVQLAKLLPSFMARAAAGGFSAPVPVADPLPAPAPGPASGPASAPMASPPKAGSAVTR